MEAATITALAVKLQERRSAPPTMGYYLAQNWRRHALFIGLYAALALFCFLTGQDWLGLLIVGFALGRQTRDLQWYRSLARDWPLTTHFIDWQKVDAAARPAFSPQDASP